MTQEDQMVLISRTNDPVKETVPVRTGTNVESLQGNVCVMKPRSVHDHMCSPRLNIVTVIFTDEFSDA